MPRRIRKWGKPAVEVEQAVLDEGERIGNVLRRYLRVINGISTVSPLLGLVGTVWGMMQAFNVIATSSAMGRAEMLAGGISVALITTAAGLMVAIPAMILYLYFVGRVDSLVMEIDRHGQELVNLISAEALEERKTGRSTVFRRKAAIDAEARTPRLAAKYDSMPLKLQHDEPLQLNLTSMIDVLFLLIIFFMVATKFGDLERNMELQGAGSGRGRRRRCRRPSRWWSTCLPTATRPRRPAGHARGADGAARRSPQPHRAAVGRDPRRRPVCVSARGVGAGGLPEREHLRAGDHRPHRQHRRPERCTPLSPQAVEHVRRSTSSPASCSAWPRSGRCIWRSGAALAVLSVVLVVLMRSRWGRRQPLYRCAVLSLLVHVVLVGLTMTVRLVVGDGGAGTGPPIHVRLVDDVQREGPITLAAPPPLSVEEEAADRQAMRSAETEDTAAAESDERADAARSSRRRYWRRRSRWTKTKIVDG